ncbi:hypothetical protein HYV43_01865 [Candidatus Micrarchaeota archaeon]|nr:hypothetical protein [Candidatus Micrarchaeota archaeon]
MPEEATPQQRNLQRFEEIVRENQDLKRRNAELEAQLKSALEQLEKLQKDDLEFSLG